MRRALGIVILKRAPHERRRSFVTLVRQISPWVIIHPGGCWNWKISLLFASGPARRMRRGGELDGWAYRAVASPNRPNLHLAAIRKVREPSKWRRSGFLSAYRVGYFPLPLFR